MVTTMVAPQPPALGRDLPGMASISWQNACPWRTSVGRFWSMSVLVCRTGEVRAISILSSAWPWKDGIRNRPWTVPASSSRMLKVTRRAAAASWSASTLAS